MPTYKQDVRPQADSLKIVELFETVQGEGIYIGVPSVFFRTGMCNLECAGCDTKWDEWKETSTDEAIVAILKYNAKHVVFTGGEPTLHQAALAKVMYGLPVNYTFTVESNGAVPITSDYLLARVNLWSFSPKVGSLGYDEKFSREIVLENLLRTMGRAQLKYVLDPNIEAHVDSVFAFQDRVDGLPGNPARCAIQDDRVFFQPYDRGTLVNIYARQVQFNINEEYNADLKKLTTLVLERSKSRFRVVPQLHKYITFR